MNESNTSVEILEKLLARRQELEARLAEVVPFQEELERIKAAINALEGPNIEVKEGVVIINNSLSGYHKDWKWATKIKYAVRKLKEAGIRDIIEFIKGVEPDLGDIYNTVAQTASKLYNDKELKARKDGNKNIYYL